LPADWDAFAAYNRRMGECDAHTVTRAGREVAERLLCGAGTWLCPPHWYRALTAHLLPPRLAEGFGLPCGAEARERALSALHWIRRTYPLLPDRLRYVGPYQEAVARLAGRAGPDLATKALNRFWIGRYSLA
jgi:uncharacterized protein (DUF2236 family)